MDHCTLSRRLVCALLALGAVLLISSAPAHADEEGSDAEPPRREVRVIVREGDGGGAGPQRFAVRKQGGGDDLAATLLGWMREELLGEDGALQRWFADDHPPMRSLRDRLVKEGWNADRLQAHLEGKGLEVATEVMRLVEPRGTRPAAMTSLFGTPGEERESIEVEIEEGASSGGDLGAWMRLLRRALGAHGPMHTMPHGRAHPGPFAGHRGMPHGMFGRLPWMGRNPWGPAPGWMPPPYHGAPMPHAWGAQHARMMFFDGTRWHEVPMPPMPSAGRACPHCGQGHGAHPLGRPGHGHPGHGHPGHGHAGPGPRGGGSRFVPGLPEELRRLLTPFGRDAKVEVEVERVEPAPARPTGAGREELIQTLRGAGVPDAQIERLLEAGEVEVLHVGPEGTGPDTAEAFRTARKLLEGLDGALQGSTDATRLEETRRKLEEARARLEALRKAIEAVQEGAGD